MMAFCWCFPGNRALDGRVNYKFVPSSLDKLSLPPVESVQGAFFSGLTTEVIPLNLADLRIMEKYFCSHSPPL